MHTQTHAPIHIHTHVRGHLNYLFVAYNIIMHVINAILSNGLHLANGTKGQHKH